MSDPLASPTLAQLYLAQGLYDRAHRIVEQLLVIDADDGVTLALRHRLRVRAAVRLTLDGGSAGLRARVRWPDASGPDPSGRLTVVFSLWSPRRRAPWITSRSLESTETDPSRPRADAVTLRLRAAHAGGGWANACLVRASPGSKLHPIAVAEPFSW